MSRYGHSWKLAEAEKNLLRTHTTAVSSRMLYKLAQEGFRPAKYFSIDRVFRNEAIDRTHLAEFHQIEGWFPCLMQLQCCMHACMTQVAQFYSDCSKPGCLQPMYNSYVQHTCIKLCADA